MLFQAITWSKALYRVSNCFIVDVLKSACWSMLSITCDSDKGSLSTGHLGPASLKIVGGNHSLSRWQIIIKVEIHRQLQSALPHVRESGIHKIFA